MPTVSDFTSIINQLLPEPHAGLLSGMLFGTKAALSNELYSALITTGTLHIVALSGMNIAILTNLVGKALYVSFSRRIASLLTVAAITVFVLFVGASPSIVRAAVMGGISLFAPIAGRQSLGIPAWAVAVTGMLFVRPGWIAEISFQLSALASLGMICFGESSRSQEHAWKKRMEKRLCQWFGGQQGLVSESPEKKFLRHSSIQTLVVIIHGITSNLKTTLSAQVLTLPVLAFSFHRISLISPITNILIGWTIPPLTALGFIGVLAGYIWLPLGQPVAWLAWVFLEYCIRIVMTTSFIPFAGIGW